MKTWMCAALAALTLAAAPPDPVAWKLADAPARPVKPGAKFNVKLVAQIQDGWHLYSTKHVEDGPVATRIWLPEGQPFQLAGVIQSSPPDRLLDPSFNVEVEQYEGEATFTLPLTASASGPHTLAVNVSYQSCNDKICLPPKTVKVELPLK